MQLFTYYRSSASYRVRIALNLKGLRAEQVAVNLAAGEQGDEAYTSLNPQGLVPALLTEDDVLLTQSLAMMEYLDERYPDKARLLPEGLTERARVRALGQAIACEMAPLNNLRVLKFLTGELGVSEEQKLHWYRHWIAVGFAAVEAMLQDPATGRFCHGDHPTMADCCLVPQVYNAERFSCDMSAYPTIMRIVAHCVALPAFADAHPANQPDGLT